MVVGVIVIVIIMWLLQSKELMMDLAVHQQDLKKQGEVTVLLIMEQLVPNIIQKDGEEEVEDI